MITWLLRPKSLPTSLLPFGRTSRGESTQTAVRTAKGMILSSLGDLLDSTFSFPATVVCSRPQPSMSTSLWVCPGWQFLCAFERNKNGKRVESKVSPPRQAIQVSLSPPWLTLARNVRAWPYSLPFPMGRGQQVGV